MHDYTCDVEIIFYQDGAENQRYRLRFYFRKEEKIRIDFKHPYKGVIVFFKGGDEVEVSLFDRQLDGKDSDRTANRPDGYGAFL